MEVRVLEAGAQIGRFQVLSPLGAGGMGEVYRARDSRLGREVALKVLPARFLEQPEKRARLEREARALASLTHPGIATLHEIVESENQLALVMELVEGENLARRLNRGPLPVPHALGVAGQIAVALDHAHQHGILHRDLKPSNVVLQDDGSARLLDFGLAKIVSPPDDAAAQEMATTTASTEVGTVLGTAPYMSPEQARGEDVDRRTDVWAFGCLLYEMLSGRQAFPGGTRADAIAAVLNSEPVWNLLPLDTPPGVRRLLRRCLQKEKAERLRDMGDVGLDLKDAVREAKTAPAPPRFRLPAGRLRTGILLFTGLVAIVAIGLATRRAVAPAGPSSPLPPPLARTFTLPAEPSPAPTPASLRIQHQPIGCMAAGQFPLIDARIEPVEAVSRARLYFKSALSEGYYYVEMIRSSGSFVAKLPKPQLAASPVSYYIVADTGPPEALTEGGRTPEASADVVAAPRARDASEPAIRGACPAGARMASFGPPGAVTVYAAGGADLVLSLKDVFGLEDLVAALQDPVLHVREGAAESLGAIGPATTRALAAAVQRLSDPDPNVREEATSDLAQTGRRVTRQVMMGLVAALADPEMRVRAAAARALGEIGPGVASAVVALRRRLKDPDSRVRRGATEALSSIGTALAPAIAALERVWNEDEGASAEAAKSALDRIQTALSPSPLPKTDLR